MEDKKDRFLSLPAGGFLTSDALSDGERTVLQVKLWQLLARRTDRYVTGDSSSVPLETAQELLASICFTLDGYLQEEGKSRPLLVDADLDELFLEGVKKIEAKIAAGKKLWRAACLSAPVPPIENISLQDTLRGVGAFFKRYDYLFLAHQIPCDLDYQLCRPVPDAYLGISYINEYLRRVVTENGILNRFEKGLVIRLLESYVPDYKNQLVNLCEPVIVNAVGLALLGGHIPALDITKEDRSYLAALFEPMSEKEGQDALTGAARRFCKEAGLFDTFTRRYIADTARDLAPRIRAALPAGHLDGIFLSLK